MRAYDRVRLFSSTTNSARISLQYKPLLPWLLPWRFCLMADDDDGLTLEQVESVVTLCSRHKLTMAELAFDSGRGSVVDRRVVLQHAKFGKSRLRTDRGGSTNLRYGSRKSPKMVRTYDKEVVNSYRIELECHSGLLRKHRISTVFELGRLAGMLVPAHIQFVGFRWSKLERYLIRRFGQKKGTSILGDARDRADSSLQAATRFLSECGVPNPHRFQSPLQLNLRLQKAIECWVKKFPVDDEMVVETK
jgi:hypothetical protein